MSQYVVGVEFGTLSGAAVALQAPARICGRAENTVPEAIRGSGVSPDDVMGIGADFTASSPLPAGADGTPLSALAEYADRPQGVRQVVEALCGAISDQLTASSPKSGESCGCMSIFGFKNALMHRLRDRRDQVLS